MQNYSTTQATNIGKIVGLILMVSGKQVDDASIAGFVEVVGLIVSVVSTAWNWIHRQKKGDLNGLGGRI